MIRLPLRLLLLGALSLASFDMAPAQAQTSVFVPLGDAPGDVEGSYVRSVSANGSVVLGFGILASGESQASRWTSATGTVGLGYLIGGSYSAAYASSADGSVVFGESDRSQGRQAFRWTAVSGLIGIGDLPGGASSSAAYGASSDGLVAVGQGTSASGLEAFRWTQSGGMVGLGDLPGGAFGSYASGVSSDGTVVVGYGESANGTESFRWTSGGGMVGLGDFAGSAFNSRATGVSANGAVVVGLGDSASGREAYRWTAATGLVGLGDLTGGGFFSAATNISADGSVIVGYSQSAVGDEAFLWTANTGMVGLKRYLLDNYASSLPSNFASWRLRIATGVSGDGSVIVGDGIDPSGKNQPWLIRLPVRPIVKWRPVDIAVNRTDNTSRLLWRQSNGRYAVWKLSPTGALDTGKFYGPISGYTCEQIAVAPNGQTTLMWKDRAGGRTALWTLASDLSNIIKATVYANPANYTPQNIAVDQDNNVRMTLRSTNGQVVFWTIVPATGAITSTGSYGPYTSLQDGSIAVGADGQIRLLWNDVSNGQALVWTLPAAYGDPTSGYTYGPVANATATDIAVGADNKTRLQWTYDTGADVGKIALWKLNTSETGTGAVESGKFYGPFLGVAPLGLSVGGDNQTRRLWTYKTGKAALWVLDDPLTTISAAYTYGPLF